ncbi:probable inactive receptor kinase At1g48480 [Ananas comosus]|uniref:Probable inactive receptor kinase At1g48480 n=1 Tax=Ananas comosus TaxID=4615 RepID=A0A6P5FS05_ANACO|nr:probable inactive receptor kinase At1g48480 [Ananas comosus]
MERGSSQGRLRLARQISYRLMLVTVAEPAEPDENIETLGGLCNAQRHSHTPLFSVSLSLFLSLPRRSRVTAAPRLWSPRPPPPPQLQQTSVASPSPFGPSGGASLLVSAGAGRPPGTAASDAAALQALRSAVGRSALPWSPSAAACSWQGVGCDAAGRVVSLRLPGVGLIGEVPAGTLGNLTALRTLSLRFNALSGALPGDLAALSELRNLYLQRNRLSGEIPAAIFALPKLVRLNLAGNNFSGEISPAFNNLTRLGTLYLEENQLSGEIPDLNLPSLVQFNVSFNNLSGSIPSRLRKMPASSFLSTGLCGGPLGLCPGEIAPSPAEGPGGGGGAGGGGESNKTKKKKKLSGGAIAGIAVGCAIGALLLLALLVLLCKRRGAGRSKTRSADAAAVERKLPESAAAEGRENGHSAGGGAASASAAATAAAASKGDSGGAGAGAKKLVFFGGPASAVLESGTTVAVKRLKEVSLPEREFREKVEAVGSLRHENLVPLMAYYYSKDEKLLVYDYMPMGSLSALLHGNRGSGRTPLNWETRLNIALSAARGVAYIHSAGPPSANSHGNIKSSNVLLSKSYAARVSDHGLAPLVGPLSSPSRVAGYRAPEVTDPHKVSQKADIYSFGVLLLELLTGKAPTQALLNEEGVDLPRWVQSVVREEWTQEVFDLELLRYQNVEEEMVQLLQLAIDCAVQYPDNRPPMSEVVSRIEEIQKSGVRAADKNESQSIEDGGDDRSSARTESIEGPRQL